MALKEKLIDKAQKLIQKGSLDKAIVEYRAAADADPKDISIRLRIGDLFVKIGKKTEAMKEYTEAARANAQRGFYLKAIAVYKQILKLEDTIETRNKLADLYIKQRLIADAIGEYSFMVNWFEKRGKSSEVLELLKKMVEIDPENVGVRLKLAELYQKLSFKEDSLSEYSVIFEKLIAAGKLDTAEKIYLPLYTANPTDRRVLSGLAELYRLRGNDAERLKFLRGLFNYYSGASMTEEARAAAHDIVKLSPNDPHASRFLKKEEKTEPVVARPAGEQEPFSIASSSPTSAASPGQAIEATEAPVEALPVEEEIEITIEGFDEASTAGDEEAAVEKAPGYSVEPVSSMDSDGAPPVSQARAADSVAGNMVEVDIDELLKGELPVIEVSPVESAGLIEASQAPVEETEPVAAVEKSAGPGEEALHAEAVIEEAAPEPVAQESGGHAVEAGATAAAGNEPLAEIELEEPVVEHVEAASVVEEAVAAEAVDIKTEPVVELAAPAVQPAQTEAVHAVEVEVSAPGSPVEPVPDEVSRHEAEVRASSPAAAAAEEPVTPDEVPGEELKEEELSSAFQELMEKMEPAVPEAPEATRAAEAGVPSEEYVDLSAELGMEEASEDLAEPWGGKESAETFDEFKTGIGKQLSKEDSETHYNLGIAYMEMELYGEASKEFKIALKDARLELDCYTRLGFCAMAEKNPEEAAAYYSKGLKAAVRSDEEKKGLMYELALAHEASGNGQDAYTLFSEICKMDPGFREAALKVSAYVSARPLVPLNDGLIEVEFL